MFTPMGIGIAARLQAADPDPSGEDVVELRRKVVLQVNRFGRELEPVDIARNVADQSITVDGGFKMG